MTEGFRILPVLDLMNGMVVRGIRGERSRYKPVESRLSASAEIEAVAEAFNRRYGFSEFYVADLDAIMSAGERNQFELLARLRERMPGLSFIVDAGARNAAEVARVLAGGADKAIVGTETLPSLEAWRRMSADIPERLMASIDTVDDGVMSAADELSRMSPADAIRVLCNENVRECILLSLSRVGTGAGLNHGLILECADAVRQKNGMLFFGGGVSCTDDLRWLRANGVAGALVASVFHDSPPEAEEIRDITGEVL